MMALIGQAHLVQTVAGGSFRQPRQLEFGGWEALMPVILAQLAAQLGSQPAHADTVVQAKAHWRHAGVKPDRALVGCCPAVEDGNRDDQLSGGALTGQDNPERSQQEMEGRSLFRIGESADPLVQRTVKMDGMAESARRISPALAEKRLRQSWKPLLPIGTVSFEGRRYAVFGFMPKLLWDTAEIQGPGKDPPADFSLKHLIRDAWNSDVPQPSATI